MLEEAPVGLDEAEQIERPHPQQEREGALEQPSRRDHNERQVAAGQGPGAQQLGQTVRPVREHEAMHVNVVLHRGQKGVKGVFQRPPASGSKQRFRLVHVRFAAGFA